jgi:hypothetical protein
MLSTYMLWMLQVNGKRHGSYGSAVRSILGGCPQSMAEGGWGEGGGREKDIAAIASLCLCVLGSYALPCAIVVQQSIAPTVVGICSARSGAGHCCSDVCP